MPGSLSVMLSPDTTKARPSGSWVTVGYQRATLMSAPWAQVPVCGLKRIVSLMPS